MRVAPMLIALVVLAAACTGDDGPRPARPATVATLAPSPVATESSPFVLPAPWTARASGPRAGVIVIEVDGGTR